MSVALEEKVENSAGLVYLGHGLTKDEQKQKQKHKHKRNNVNERKWRPHIKPGGILTVRLLVDKRSDPEAVRTFIPLTLQALGLFCGAGARSRRGFGSLSLLSLSVDRDLIWQAPADIGELAERQRQFLESLRLGFETADQLPDYTAFSSHTKVWIGKTDSQPLDLLNDIGLELMRYRSYGMEKDGIALCRAKP